MSRANCLWPIDCAGALRARSASAQTNASYSSGTRDDASAAVGPRWIVIATVYLLILLVGAQHDLSFLLLTTTNNSSFCFQHGIMVGKMTDRALDEIDLRILNNLQPDAKLTNVELA